MTPEQLNRTEILQLLHTPEPDAEFSAMLDAAAEELCAAVRERRIWRVLPVTHTESGVALGGLALGGQDIAKHLSGCGEAVLLGATLSAGVDALICRAEHTDMLRALMFDAIAGAAIERVCDDLTAELRQTLPYPYFTERFSPGYGDFPLTQQGALVQMLDAARKIGLTVTPHSTMIPMKSVTALIGLSHSPVQDARRFGCGRDCGECPYRDGCSMRSEE